MKQQTRDFLIRNLPIEIHELLEKAAEEHHRSKTQEAIVALSNGLVLQRYRVQQPRPLKWKTKISNTLIHDAIEEGRE